MGDAVWLEHDSQARDHNIISDSSELYNTGFADAAAAPIDFPTAPTLAIPKALKAAGVTQDKIALYELNEAFSVVVRAAEKIMDVSSDKINVKGGAVALGHVSD